MEMRALIAKVWVIQGMGRSVEPIQSAIRQIDRPVA